MSNRKVDYYVTREGKVQTLWIKNHSHSRPLLKTNDPRILGQRIHEIEEDCKKLGKRAEAIISIYRWARDHGCVVIMTPEPDMNKGVLKMRPEGDRWLLLLARGKQEIILARDTREVVKAKYINLNKRVFEDRSILSTMWDYAMTKQRFELREEADMQEAN